MSGSLGNLNVVLNLDADGYIKTAANVTKTLGQAVTNLVQRIQNASASFQNAVSGISIWATTLGNVQRAPDRPRVASD